MKISERERVQPAEASGVAGQQAKKGVLPLVALAFPLFLSVDLDHVSPALDGIVNAWKILSTVAVVFWYVNRLIGRKPTPAHVFPMGMVMFALLFSTLENSGSLQRYFIVWGGFFAVCLLVEARIKEHPLQLLLALKIVLGTLTVVNCATVLLFPQGLWSTATEGFWLLGHRNNFGEPLIAALVVGAAYDLLTRRALSRSTLAIAAASLISVTRTWSASSVLTIVLTIGMVLLVAISSKGLRGVRPSVLLALYAAADVGIVVFRVQERASDLIAEYLHRSADLTGRTHLWDIVFGMIREAPLTGHGIQLSRNNGLTIYNSNFVHAHNGELDVLMQGGLLTFVPFVAMILLVTRRAAQYYDHRVVQVLYMGLILMMVRAITGLFFSSYAVLIVFLLLNSGTLVRIARDPLRGRRPSAPAQPHLQL